MNKTEINFMFWFYDTVTSREKVQYGRENVSGFSRGRTGTDKKVGSLQTELEINLMSTNAYYFWN